jgi:hypothetical protein
MANYTKSTNFATKDSLASGNPLKVIKGTEIDDEFEALETAIATKPDSLDVADDILAAKKALYPVGTIYINATNSTNPATLLGFGTWTAFGAGRVPVGIDSSNTLFDTAEETGGSADAIVVSHTHTGTTDTDGEHNHYIVEKSDYSYSYANDTTTSDQSLGNGLNDGGAASYLMSGPNSTTDQPKANFGLSSNAGDHNHAITMDSTGSSGTDANYQPYITVYMWKRTA